MISRPSYLEVLPKEHFQTHKEKFDPNTAKQNNNSYQCIKLLSEKHFFVKSSDSIVPSSKYKLEIIWAVLLFFPIGCIQGTCLKENITWLSTEIMDIQRPITDSYQCQGLCADLDSCSAFTWTTEELVGRGSHGCGSFFRINGEQVMGCVVCFY